jgi:hypothetical protein
MPTLERGVGNAELPLSFLEGFVRERQVVFANPSYLTSKRFYDLCPQHDLRTTGNLSPHVVLSPQRHDRLEIRSLLRSRQEASHDVRISG